MKQVYKEYPRPFLLEPTKLTRLVAVIHERLMDHNPTMKRDIFEAFLAGNRHEQMSAIDEVLALENSRKQKIDRLIINCSAGRKVAARHDDEIQVDFGGKSTTDHRSMVVAITVRSDDAGWASRCLAELEEQAVRTLLPYRQPILLLAVLLVCAVVLLLSQFVSFAPRASTDDVLRAMWLRGNDLDRVEQMVANDRTITDAEIREVVSRQLRNLLEDQRPQQAPVGSRARRIAFIAVPLLVVVACGVILLATCYPRAVFLGGDEEARYRTVLQRRKALWGIFVGIMVIGVLSNSLFIGLASSLRLE